MRGKTLITGASGLLGRTALRLWWEKGDEVVGQGFNRLVYRGVRLDLRDLLQSHVILKMLELGSIIHCAAERRPDVCAQKPEEAIELNVAVSRVLAKFCGENNLPFIYLSTDYVFDGTQAPYSPSDPTSPANLYGETKRNGELAVLEVCPKAKILRVPVLYGDVENLNECALTTIVQTMKNSAISYHDHESIRYPTHVVDVANVLYQMLQRYDDLNRSIYHWSAKEAFTKFQIAEMLKRKFYQFKNCEVKPEVLGPDKVKRPYDCHLNRSDLEKLGIHSDSEFLKSFAEIIKKHL